jgi:hypothetical protein
MTRPTVTNLEHVVTTTTAEADADFQRQSSRFGEILRELAQRDQPVPDNMLGVAQVAARFELCKQTIILWISEGKLAATKDDKGRWRVTPEEVRRRQAEWQRLPWTDPYEPKPKTTTAAFVRGANGKPRRTRLRS